MTKRGKDWCVLRTSGPNTLKLAASLAEAGYDVWSPIEHQVRRKPRSKIKEERTVCVMPTYVFARAAHIVDLLAIREDPASPHPGYSIFRHDDKFPLIADRDLESLRQIERKAAIRKAPVNFPAGSEVRLADGPFGGMTGVVEHTQGQFTLVCFPNYSTPIKIASFLLAEDVAEDSGPLSGNAARAA